MSFLPPSPHLDSQTLIQMLVEEQYPEKDEDWCCILPGEDCENECWKNEEKE